MTPKYLDKIKNIAESGLLSLNGNRILIELLVEGEKTSSSGLVVELAKEPKNFAAADRTRIGVVLAVGPGYETEAGEKVDLNYKPGDYVLVNQFGVKTFSDFFGISDYKPDSIGLITDDLVHGKISDLEQFRTLLKAK